MPHLLISAEYRAQLSELHQRNSLFGTSGHFWTRHVLALAADLGTGDILDYGCGRGTLAEGLRGQGVEAHEYDPAVIGKDDPPEPADLVVCGDVLEHVEPDCLHWVMDDIRQLSKKAVFLVVSTKPAKKTLADGRNAHLIVEPAWWWLGKIMARWELQSFQNHGPVFSCIATVPK